MNNAILVGRIKGIEEDTNVIMIEVSTKETTTLLPVKLSEGIADRVKEYCKVDDVVGIKGSLTCEEINGNVLIVAEKVSFLSSKAEEEL